MERDIRTTRREDAEVFRETLVVDCAAAASCVKETAARVTKVLSEGRRHGYSSVLFHRLENFSAESVACIVRLARKKGFEGVKVELSCCVETAAVRKIIEAGAGEIYLKVGRDEWKESIEYIREMFSQEVNGDLSNSIRVKAEIAGSAKEARKYLGELAGAGAAYIVAEVSRGARAGEKAKIMKSCEEIARGRDVSVELRIGDTTEMFRSSPLRAREARELLLDVPYCHAGGRKIALGAVFQLGFACSQDCIFCTSDRMLPEVSCGEILATLDDVVGQGIQHVVFTGGEPTLNRSLGKFISRCRDSGVTEISLYTNGMALASKQYAKKTVDAGMTFALVSLHSASPKTADAITRCRGGYERTVAGIDNLLQLGTMTAVNYVVNAVNFKETPDFVRFMKRRFTGAALNFSYVAPVMKASATTGIVPKFTEAAPYLKEALEICDEYGIDAAGLEPHWGIPPCALDGDARYFPLLAPLGEKLSGFVKAAACAKCRANSACPGVRKFYGELYGLDELKPLKKDKRA